MFTQAINELTGQGGGELEELISVEERRHCGVQADGGGREKTNKKIHYSVEVDFMEAYNREFVAGVANIISYSDDQSTF